MYLIIVVLLMGVLPVVSIVAELIAGTGGGLLLLVGKWFVFWAVGVRLFTAGIRQTLAPGLTASQIFKINDPGAGAIVREIGFGNLAMGAGALLSLYFPVWVPGMAAVGAIFYGLAGLGHVFRHRNQSENIAMISDLAIAAVLAIYLIGLIIRG